MKVKPEIVFRAGFVRTKCFDHPKVDNFFGYVGFAYPKIGRSYKFFSQNKQKF